MAKLFLIHLRLRIAQLKPRLSNGRMAETAEKPLSLTREPLLHFIIIAALLLGAHRLWEQWRGPELRMDTTKVEMLAREQEQRLGRKPTAQEMARQITDYVEDEILFRAALERGLVEENRPRALLVHMMRSTLRPVLPEPTQLQLEQVLATLPEEERRFPAQVSFEHVSFHNEQDVPPGLLERLRSGASAQGQGADIRLANPLPLTYQPQIERLLGADFVRHLMGYEPNVWHGPLRSTRGVHFIRVLQKLPPREIPFDELRAHLTARWQALEENAAISRATAEMGKKYRIITPQP